MGDRARVTGCRFFADATSELDIEKEPFVLENDANSQFHGLRGYIASLKSLSNLLGDRSVENASGLIPGLFRISLNVGLFNGL